MVGDGGKGSAQRPIANRKTFEENWDAIFTSRSGSVGSNTDGCVDVGDRPRDQAGQEGSVDNKPSE